MASFFKESPSMSNLLTFYASISTLSMIIRTILNEIVPRRARDFFTKKFIDFFSNYFADFTFVIEDRWQAVPNETFRAVEIYLPTRISSDTRSLILGNNDNNNITGLPKSNMPTDSKVIDEFENMRLEWILKEKETNQTFHYSRKRYFNLTCKKRDRDRVMKEYIPQVCRTAKSILDQREKLYIYTYDDHWVSTVFKHPATFKTLALDSSLKNSIIDDLNLFCQRKEYFQSVGRAWKRGYLLYGPPGTGKSTLVAAIANYLRFNIYDLQLQNVKNDAELRRVLTATANRSILLIEDIDCSTKARARGSARDIVRRDGSNRDDDRSDNKRSFDPGVTLSGLLNFIDGLWSTCGDERIIIFTTNYKEKIDPALLRPGRMDVPIYMGYCSPAGFRNLASTYLSIEDHLLFNCIDDLIKRIEITPAEVAQHLMKFGDPKIALESLIKYLRMKEIAKEGNGTERAEEDEVIKQEEVKFIAKEHLKVVCGKQGGKDGDVREEDEISRSIYLS
ncbi:hypothetical protein K2173_006120 [Erythroxylum novogranatense]|uniref:AAA+ ATPase domain-containing protein n=1 Tax=Erythroxylum novogranatense TaxID=1862640 RepID=A0AAV8TCC0_9ROSI|nr:hypothetical protein K2173_006120 [Erythroxylum novogranatense]